MSWFLRAGLLAALFLVPLPRPAHASPGGWVYTYSYYPAYYPAYVSVPVRVSYYAPAGPVYTFSQPVVCAPTVTVSVPAPVYAVPTAAPPSETIEPPPAKRTSAARPSLTESRSGAAKPGKGGNPGEGPVRVGFWNVSGRDLTLTIDGRVHTLPRNRNLTLNLGRNFVWRVDSRAPQSEAIPAGNPTLEIVLRR